MKYKFKKICVIFATIYLVMFTMNYLFAHSGRTDSNGGHRDNQNKSGLGSYHYHCGGYPAHLHTNGICPYSSNSVGSSTSNNEITSEEPVTILATDIQINESISSLKVGESKKITATIMPTNTTDKNITWKTSDEKIATITSEGEIIAKSSGIVIITVSTSNGKTDSIKIEIEDIVLTTISNNIEESSESYSSEELDPIGSIVTLGLIGGGSYFGYKKYKKSKEK